MAYDRAFSTYYDRLMEDMPYDEWLSFLFECWERFNHSPKRIVDLGSGTGNIAIPLVLQGFTILGLDRSAEMLNIAEQKAQSSHLPVQWYEADEWKQHAHPNSLVLYKGDFRRWSISTSVDTIVSLCDSLNYVLEPLELRSTFANAYDQLGENGMFVFDLHHPQIFHAYAEEQPFVYDEPDLAYIWTSSLDEQRLQIEHQLTIFASESGDNDLFTKFEEVHAQRAYSFENILNWLEAAGFSHIQAYGDFSFEPIDDETERMFFVAIK